CVTETSSFVPRDALFDDRSRRSLSKADGALATEPSESVSGVSPRRCKSSSAAERLPDSSSPACDAPLVSTASYLKCAIASAQVRHSQHFFDRREPGVHAVDAVREHRAHAFG